MKGEKACGMKSLTRGNAPEGMQATPETLGEHLEMQNRQRENDRKRLAMARGGLGISV